MEQFYECMYRDIDNARIMNGGPAVFVDEHGNHKYFKAKVLPNGELELIKEIDPNESKKNGISKYFITCDSDDDDTNDDTINDDKSK
jgi:hypothetical protein